MRHPITKSHLLSLMLALLTILGIGGLRPNLTLAAGIVVNSTADNTTAGDGNCTLREAIANANGDSDTTSGDTITFAAGIAGGTITLGGASLAIDKPLTITGPSAGMTIDGNNASRVFDINNSTVAMSNLTITNATAVDTAGNTYIAGSFSGTTLTG